MSDKSERLLGLAKAAFPDLTNSERKVVEAAAKGEDADFQSDDPEKDDPARSETWPDERKVRASVLRWLCTDAAARRLVDPKGLCVVGARIEGRLDLSFAKIPFPLGLLSSAIPKGISLLHTRTVSISLVGTHMGPISADGLTAEGGVFLRKGFHAKGEVRLPGARIRGGLSCNGGTFEGAERETPEGKTIVALSADRLKVGGSVFLSERFHAKGEVRLPGARIRGNLSCNGGAFENPGSDALTADNLDVGGGLFLRQGFQATGKVSLAHAKARILVDDEDSWPDHGDLDLRGFLYESIIGPTDAATRLRWLARQYPEKRRRGDYHPQPYEQLAAVLRGMGHEADAKKVCIAREQDRRKYGSMGLLAKAWSLFLGATLGHGYAVWHVGVIALAIVALGWAVFWLGENAGLMVPISPRAIAAAPEAPSAEAPGDRGATPQQPNPQEHLALCPIIYSLDVFLPIVNLRREERWEPESTRGVTVLTWPWALTWGGLLWRFLWFETLSGWLLVTLALAGLTGLIRRD